MTKKQFYQAYLAIKVMDVSYKCKRSLLQALLTSYEDCWKVIGITKEALELFSKNEFRYVKGINRSHLVQRQKTLDTMLTQDFNDCDSWWDFFIESDKTIMATSTQNLSKSFEENPVYINIDTEKGLFKPNKVGWRHSKIEREYLKNLFDTL